MTNVEQWCMAHDSTLTLICGRHEAAHLTCTEVTVRTEGRRKGKHSHFLLLLEHNNYNKPWHVNTRIR